MDPTPVSPSPPSSSAAARPSLPLQPLSHLHNHQQHIHPHPLTLTSSYIAASVPQPPPLPTTALGSAASSSASRKPLRVPAFGRDAVPLHHPQTPASSHPAAATPISRVASCSSSSTTTTTTCSHALHSPSTSSSFYPDPLVDVTRLRVRSQGHHCLYPGASFQGTQKSGRNSYDVNVTIVVRPLFPLPL